MFPGLYSGGRFSSGKILPFIHLDSSIRLFASSVIQNTLFTTVYTSITITIVHIHTPKCKPRFSSARLSCLPSALRRSIISTLFRCDSQSKPLAHSIHCHTHTLDLGSTRSNRSSELLQQPCYQQRVPIRHPRRRNRRPLLRHQSRPSFPRKRFTDGNPNPSMGLRDSDSSSQFPQSPLRRALPG